MLTIFKKSKKIFYFLSVFVFLISIILIAWPWLPQFTWILQNTSDISQTKKAQTLIDAKEQLVEFDFTNGNYLIIPAIDVASPIYEGETDNTLAKGVWRIPSGSTPEHESNTILTAHRFQYTFGPQTFYHLDKLKKGDTIYVYWQGIEYTYEVTQTFGVSDTSVEIEDPTSKPLLTLYTCELFDTSKRLGVHADLKSKLRVAVLE